MRTQTEPVSASWLSRLFGKCHPAVEIAVALGLAGCATTETPPARSSGRTFDHEPRARFSQLDYPDTKLGDGRFTIASSGCFLTSLAMASCVHHQRTDLNPVVANARVRTAGGFSGSGLELPIAARALGLSVTHRETLGASNRARLGARLDAELAAKRPSVVGVDLGPGRSSGESDADHFILIYEKRGDRYLAVDPAGGGKVELTADAAGHLRYSGDDTRVVTEMIFLAKGRLEL